jgi:hypothetical protein
MGVDWKEYDGKEVPVGGVTGLGREEIISSGG